MNVTTYDSHFYTAYADVSSGSAREILTILQRVVQPTSVVDVGCGIGTWLKVWLDFGVSRVMGIDGGYVQPDDLLIPIDRFRPMDLTAPRTIGAQFDLVQSLEVAEHLPQEAAEGFVAFLCSLGPIVLFSAAIPYQGGTKHVNEQWPDYWAALFARQGYIPLDIIRDQVWNNPAVAYYYAQNALVFARVGDARVAEIFGTVLTPSNGSLSRVHPSKWQQRHENPLPLIELIAMFPRSVHALFLRAMAKGRRVLFRHYPQVFPGLGAARR